jgi:hypothetical protein
MRWLTRLSAGAVLHWRTVAFLVLLAWTDVIAADGQSVESDSTGSLLSLRRDLIFAGTTLVAQNEQNEEAPLAVRIQP